MEHRHGPGWLVLKMDMDDSLLPYFSHAGRQCHVVDNCPAVTNVHLVGSAIAKKPTAAAQE